MDKFCEDCIHNEVCRYEAYCPSGHCNDKDTLDDLIPQGDLISREALKKEFALLMWKEHNPYDTVKVCDIVNQTLDFIDNAPTISPYKAIHDELHKGEEE